MVAEESEGRKRGDEGVGNAFAGGSVIAFNSVSARTHKESSLRSLRRKLLKHRSDHLTCTHTYTSKREYHSRAFIYKARSKCLQGGHQVAVMSMKQACPEGIPETMVSYSVRDPDTQKSAIMYSTRAGKASLPPTDWGSLKLDPGMLSYKR